MIERGRVVCLRFAPTILPTTTTMAKPTLERLHQRLYKKERAIDSMRAHLEQIAPYVYCTWEECPKWVRKIMAWCDYESAKQWYNVILRRILLTIGQCQRIRKQINEYGKAEKTQG